MRAWMGLSLAAACCTLGGLGTYWAIAPRTPADGAPQVPSVTVALDAFRCGPSERRLDEPTYVPTWSAQAFPGLESRTDCDRLWRTLPVLGAGGNESLGLGYGADGEAERQVRTCAEWAQSLDDGIGAVNTYQITIQSFFIHWAGVLPNLPHMRPSAQSTFRELDLARFACEILPPCVDRELLVRTGAERWSICGNSLCRIEEGWISGVEPAALGDLDGDGWEDMLLTASEHSRQGSHRSYTNLLVARRGDGRLVSITGRMAERPCTEAVMDARRAEWRANFGLPATAEFELHGTCECGPIDVAVRSHGMRMRLRSEGGYLTGSCRCDVNAREIPVAGALWSSSKGMLHEFGIDGAWTAELGFTWRVEKGELFIDGRRIGTGQMESDGWSVRGKSGLGGSATD